MNNKYDHDLQQIINKFCTKVNNQNIEYDVIQKGGEDYLVITTGANSEFFLNSLSEVKSELPDDNMFKSSVYLKERKVTNWLKTPETEYLRTLLSESLTMGKSSFNSSFPNKVIPFVGGEELTIDNKTNNIVFGRRGAGKSSLLLYGMDKINKKNMPYVWIAMQQYQGRSDLLVIPQVLYELVEQTESFIDSDNIQRLKKIVYELEDAGEELTFSDIKIKLAIFGRYFKTITRSYESLYIFIDDLYLLSKDIQPLLLSGLYSFARGNNIYLKISSIEHLTKSYDITTSEGMQSPGDIQIIRLDYNLVNPEKANKHIQDILTTYIQYAGIPSLSSLCNLGAQHRLTWVSAGVPRDAMYIFHNSIRKAINEDRKHVTKTDINMSAGDSMSEKEKYLSDDVSGNIDELKDLIEQIKHFCIDQAKSNAFLVHIEHDNPVYQQIQKLIDLRFLHILHPGITPDRRNEKYEALLLDYAFYTGFRRTSTIKEFKEVPKSSTFSELRGLSKFVI